MDQVRILEIPVELLLEHPENSNLMNAETAQKLRRHIEQTGRYEPLTVRPHPSEEGKFQVINGHNRLKVLRTLKFEKANCVV
jgi:ParB-like chromosome segregation protein Spo0J